MHWKSANFFNLVHIEHESKANLQNSLYKIRFCCEYKMKITANEADWCQGLLSQLIFVKPNLQMHHIFVTLPQMHHVLQDCDVSWSINRNVININAEVWIKQSTKRIFDKCDWCF